MSSALPSTALSTSFQVDEVAGPAGESKFEQRAGKEINSQSTRSVNAATTTTSAAISSNAVTSNISKSSEIDIELDHMVAYNPRHGCLHYHPNGHNYLFTVHAALIIGDFNNIHSQRILHGHDDAIECVALSKTGKYIATGQRGKNADVVIWDFETGNILYRFGEHDFGLAAIAFSDDEKLVATAGVAEDKKLILWDMSNGFIVTTTSALPAPIKTMTFAGKVKDIKRRDTAAYLLITGGGQVTTCWSINAFTGEIIGDKVLADGRASQVRNVQSLAVHEGRELLYAGNSSGDFSVVTLKDKRIRATVPVCRSGVNAVLSLGSKYNDYVLTGGGDGSLVLCDKDLVIVKHIYLQGAIVSFSLSPTGDEVLVGTTLGNLYRVQVSTLSHVLVSQAHSNAVSKIAYSNEASDRFATIADDCSIRIWDVSDYSVIVYIPVRDAGKPFSIAYNLDMTITGWEDGQIRAFGSEKGESLWTIPNAHRGGVTALALSHNGRFIISGGKEGEVRLWELRTRELVSHLKGHNLAVNSIVIYEDDLHALSVSSDRTFICWDLQTEKRVSTHVQRMGGVNDLTLGNGGGVTVTVGQEKRINWWDLREHEPLRSVNTQNEDEARSVEISPDGKWLATGGSDMILKLWSFNTGKLMGQAKGHSATITSVAFSPDGKQLTSVGQDGAILVWNLFQ